MQSLLEVAVQQPAVAAAALVALPLFSIIRRVSADPEVAEADKRPRSAPPGEPPVSIEETSGKVLVRTRSCPAADSSSEAEGPAACEPTPSCSSCSVDIAAAVRAPATVARPHRPVGPSAPAVATAEKAAPASCPDAPEDGLPALLLPAPALKLVAPSPPLKRKAPEPALRPASKRRRGEEPGAPASLAAPAAARLPR
eukprot:tig00001368_g8413.t1